MEIRIDKDTAQNEKKVRGPQDRVPHPDDNDNNNNNDNDNDNNDNDNEISGNNI